MTQKEQDKKIELALLVLARMHHHSGLGPEAKAVGAFVYQIMLPLLTARRNSDRWKAAYNGLLERSRNMEGFFEALKHGEASPHSV